MTRPLSPAAQAVMDAFTRAACGSTYQVHKGLAAAIRALMDEVVPVEPEPPELPWASDNDPWSSWYANQKTRRQSLAIAAELEGQR